jgi:hypothetical protein
VAANGGSTPAHAVFGFGSETVTLTSTTNLITTAYTGSNRIESYVLSGATNDFFRVNNASTSAAAQVKVDLSGGSSDFLVLNDSNAAFTGIDVHTTILGFTGGAVAQGGDVLQIQQQTDSLSSSGFELITAMDTDVGAGNRTLVIRSDVFTMDETWSETDAQAAFGFATDVIAAGDYTGAVYFTGGGQSGYYVMGFTTDANDAGNADFNMIGILSSTAVNTLTAANFT